jgi:hypothetical protein
MPRRKVGFIKSPRSRATTFARRLEGLKKKADELSVLCGVPVALVCADGEDAAPPFVWDSNDALAMYRALPPEAAPAHTHRAYADAELGKWVAKLARVRQGGAPALAGWDKALDAADAEQAIRVLEDVDAALAASEWRRRELGLPAFQDDGAGLLEGVAPLSRAGSNDLVHVEECPLHAQGDVGPEYDEKQTMWGNTSAMQPAGYGFHHQYPGGGVDMDDGFRLQMATTMNGHQLQMAAGMNDYTNTTDLVARNTFHQPHNAGAAQPGFASHCYGGMPGYHTQHVPINNGGLQLNPYNAAVMPVGYPSLDIGPCYMDTPAAHASQQGYAGNFINNAPPPLSPVPLSHAMGTGDNFTNAAPAQTLAIYHNGGGYTTQWPAQQQIQSASSSQQSHSGIEHLHYLSDVEDAQLQLWGN